MKIFEDRYPLGTFKKQQTAGIYVHELLYDNLKELANAIVKDNSFLVLVSSKALSVRTGKSTFTQSMAMSWLHIMETEHNIKVDFDMRNIAFNVDEFETKAFALNERGQKYAPMILDESDDLTGHSLSDEVKKIKRFLRKSGQLNLLMIMILPDFFEFPKSIAVNRSVALITVDYGAHFERGYFAFYDFKSKKKLFIKGKAFNDYGVTPSTFTGNFGSHYLVNEEEYRKEKYKDLFEDSKKQRNRKMEALKDDAIRKLYIKIYRKFKGRITQQELCDVFGITEQTACRWKKNLINDLI